ncbi:unnamed protein product, partial [Lampetra planeri]
FRVSAAQSEGGSALLTNLDVAKQGLRLLTEILESGFVNMHPNPQSLQLFYSILSSQFTLLPSLMPIFANKLGVLWLLQTGSGTQKGFSVLETDVEEVETLLRFNLPPLCCRLSDWPSLLCESPGLQLCDQRDPRATQYCLLIILHLALQQGDSLLPLQTVFTSGVRLLRSVQEQAGCPLPPSVLRSGLYLLAGDTGPEHDPRWGGISVDNVELELGHEHRSSGCLDSICEVEQGNEHPLKGSADVSQLMIQKLPAVCSSQCPKRCFVSPHSTPSSSDSKMDGVNFKLLYHVTNIAGRLKPTDTECLLPAISYLYCCLSSAPAHCMDTAVAMLLSNQRLIDQLQTLLSSSSSSPPAGPPSALLCSSHLLLSSLVTLQHVHYLRVLQALLNVDLASALVTVCSGSSLVGPRPLESEDGALYPLGFRGARCLAVSLSGLIIQKHELLLRSSVSCLCSLLGFLRRKKQAAAEFVVCQPWSRFLLHCLLSSGEQSLLHPAVVRFITLLMQHSSAVVQEAELQRLMDALEGRGSKELSQEETQTLRLLLQQVQRSPPTEEHGQRARRLMEALGSPARTDCCRAALHSNILRVGDVSVCLWDFTVQTD